MSRSYKKTPCWSAPNSRNGVHSSLHDYKRIANHKVRRPWNWGIDSGNAYRRLFNSWTLRDYVSCYYTKQAVMDAIEENDRELAGMDHPHEMPYGNFRAQDPRYRKHSLLYYYYAK